MAEWVSANFANLLPAGTMTILDTARTLIDIVSFPLEAIASVLDIAKTFLLALPPFDFSEIIRDLIEDFKNDLLGSGFYLCDMWDYPIHQLEPTTYGPDQTYGSYSTSGSSFSDFVSTLAASLDDEQDSNRPQFTGSCAMVVLIRAEATIDDLEVFIEDGNIGQTMFEGMAGTIQGAAYAMHAARMRGAFAKLRLLAEEQSQNHVATRVDRLETAFRDYTALTQEEVDLVQAPMNPETGDRFFEDTEIADISWEEDVMPFLEEVEEARLTTTYPDWNRAALRDIYPQIVDMVDAIFDPILELLQIGKTIKDQIIAFIDSIQSKVQELTDIIDQIDAFIDQIEDFLNLTGFHILFLTSSNGVSDLKAQLLAAGNEPIDTDGWFAGFSLVAGGDAVSAFELLFSPLAS